MPRKLRELRADLRKAGFEIDHVTGSHEIWKHPNLHDRPVVLVGRDGDDAQPYQERQIRRAILRVLNAEKEDSK